jgi:hypothetical protein
MPNIEALWLSNVALSKGFLQPNPDGLHANTKPLPSLRFLHLNGITLSKNDWGQLTAYLAHQISDNQIIWLQASDCPYVCPEVVKVVEGLVEEFSRH